MMSLRFAEKLLPKVPEAISEAFDLLRARRLVGQCRLLYLGLIATVPPAIIGRSDSTPVWASTWLPLLIGALLVLGYLLLLPVKPDKITPRFARKFIFDATWSTPLTGALCGLWCGVNWWYAPERDHSYFPLILALGSMATAYCLASIRFAAIANLVVGPLPIALLMLSSGHPMDIVASVSMLIASCFLCRLIFDQHNQLVELLTLQHEMRHQAHTDPLTGLLNRRALADALREQAASDAFALALLDLDGFKAVNDQHGHGIGDELLVAVGLRLREALDSDAIIARLGGDEFAILQPKTSPWPPCGMADRLLMALLPAFQIGGHQIRIGASVGVALFPDDSTAIKALYDKADAALYTMKHAGRASLPAALDRAIAA